MFLFTPQAADPDTRIAGFIFDKIGTSVTDFVNEGSATMIAIVGPVATSLLVIYVLLWGVAMASGQIREPFTDGMKRIVRMCIIIALALTVGLYQGFVADFFKQAPMQIASQMTIPGAAATPSVDSMAEMLDNCLGKGFQVARKPWDEGVRRNSEGMMGISGEGLAFQALSVILYIIVVLVVAIAAGLVFVAYMSLAILLAVGPLFIMMAIFPQTQRWFEAWLGQAVNYMIMFVLVALACGLLFKMLDGYFDNLQVQDLTETLMVTLKAIGLSIAMTGVLLQMNSVAAALGGGAAIQATNVAGKLAGLGMSAAMGAGGVTRAFAYGMAGKGVPRQVTARGTANAAGQAIGRRVLRARQTFHKPSTIHET